MFPVLLLHKFQTYFVESPSDRLGSYLTEILDTLSFKTPLSNKIGLLNIITLEPFGVKWI